MTGQLIFDFDLHVFHRVQFHHVLNQKSSRFEDQFHRLNWYRMFVCRIEIEVTTSDEEVFRVGCFENEDSTWFECAANFVEKPHERLDRQMLDEVKRRDGVESVFRERVQMNQRFSFADVE